MISFANYAPDRSTFDPEVTDSLENVLPIQGGYGPFPAFRPLSQPLPERPQGSYLGYVNNGNYELFAGTATKLFRFAGGPTLGWIDVSKASGYSTPSGERWSFAQYGSWLIATNGVDPVQYLDLTLPTQFADLSPDAPRARLVGTMGDFIMLAHLNTNQRMVQWSGLNQPQFWTPRQRSSDFQAFPDGGEIMGFAGGVSGCLIFHAESVREGNLALETSMVMTFKQTLTNHGCMAPKSVVATGAGIFYLSDDGFYKYGVPPVGIGVERIDNTFIDDISRQEIYNVYGSEDPNRKIVYWAYRSIANNVAHSYDKVLLYHYGIDRWSLLKPNRIMTGLIDAATPGIRLDEMNATFGFTLETLPYSLDSRAWSGGTPSIAAFDEQFRLGFFSGDPLRAVLQTGDVELTSGSRSIVTGFRPLCDAPEISGRTGVRNRAGGTRNWKNPANVSAKTGLIPARASGRFHRFEVTIPADQQWSAIHGVEPEGQPEGQQ